MYKEVKCVYGINETISKILVEDETKLKGRVVWEHRWDMLLNFYGCNVNHIYVLKYKVVVGFDEGGYNTIFNCFCINVKGRFVRVIMVYSVHEKLLPLVLMVILYWFCLNKEAVGYHWWSSWETRFNKPNYRTQF